MKHQRKLQKMLKNKKQRVKVDKNIWISWKEIILNEVKKGGNGDTGACAEPQGDNATNDATNTTTSANTPATGAITTSSDVYICDIVYLLC